MPSLHPVKNLIRLFLQILNFYFEMCAIPSQGQESRKSPVKENKKGKP